MNATSQRHALMASALAISLQGCASVNGDAPKAELNIRPAQLAGAAMSATDGLYNDAVAAIDRRDYARALDLLQVARDRSPGDARVLNAFGVVYDKLGRFDLSARYYAQAQAADPGSSIVAQNQAYSQVLQGEITPVAVATAAAAPPAAPAVQAQAVAVTSSHSLARALPVLSAPAEAPRQAAAAAPAPPVVTAALPMVTSSPVLSVSAAEPLVVRLAAMVRQPLIQNHAPRWQAPAPDVVPLAVSTAQNPAPVAPRATRAAAATPATPAALPPGVMASAPKAELLRAEAPARIFKANIQIAQAEGRPAPVAVHAPAARPAPAPAAPAGVALRPVRPRPAVAALPIRVAPRPTLMGRPVQVVYATGAKRYAAQLRTQLARRGWTLAVANVRTPAPAQTTIRYAPANERVALALARSLRIPVKLERCRARCSGVTILVGAKRTLRMAGAPTGGAPRLG